MKQYLLIPIEEIDSRIEELDGNYSNGIVDELKFLKSKGEIVEIEDFDVEEYKFIEYLRLQGDKPDNFKDWFTKQGFKLIKTIK